MRLQRVMELSAAGGILWGLGLTAGIYAVKLEALTLAAVGRGAALSLAVLVLLALLLSLRRISAARVAKRVDDAHGLHDRIGAALEFARERAPTGFMAAQVRDAEARAAEVSPARAVPLRWPSNTRALALVLLCLGVVSVIPISSRPASVAPEQKPLPGIAVDSRELEPYRELARELDQAGEQIPEMADLARELNQLFEQIDRQELSQKELFSKLAELQRKLMEGMPGDFDKLLERLKKMGGALKKERLTKELGERLDQAELDRAKKELERLAGELDKMDRDAQRRLARSLSRSTQDARPDKAAQAKKEQLERQLRRLKRQLDKRKDPQLRRRLNRKRRQLQRLNQEQRRRAEQRRQLQRLNREMQQAAQQLMDKLSPEAQKALQKAAEQMQRFANQKTKLDMMGKAQGQLSELKELLRRLGKGNKGNKGKLQDFYVRAGGKKGDQKGQKGKQGKGKGKDGKQGLLLGPDGQGGTVILPGPPQGQGQGQQSAMIPMPTDGVGDGSDPNLQGEATKLDSKRKNTLVRGTEGKGPTRSEVILGASDEGFATESYRQVYTDYTQVVEDVLKQESVPLGYKHFVKRYFQLIKPR